jgi:prepilin-type processing-associated H-X9-DG protein
MSAVPKPAGTLLVADTIYQVIDRPTRVDTRHNGGAVLAFCDGHAKWMSRGAYDGNWAIMWPGLDN